MLHEAYHWIRPLRVILGCITWMRVYTDAVTLAKDLADVSGSTVASLIRVPYPLSNAKCFKIDSQINLQDRLGIDPLCLSHMSGILQETDSREC